MEQIPQTQFYRCGWNSSSVSTGIHKIVVKVTDEGGNMVTIKDKFSLDGHLVMAYSTFLGHDISLWMMGGFLGLLIFFFLYLFIPKIMQYLYTHEIVKNGSVSAAWIAAIDVCFPHH